MGVREETLEALRRGLTPGQISKQKGVSLSTTLAYLNQMVGEGKLRRSDIFFSIPHEVRQVIAESGSVCPPEVSEADFKVVQAYGDGAHALGDMYDDLREVETFSHSFIKELLVQKHGDSESGWWRKGIPETIRKACQLRREEDDEPADDPYCYTDLLDLGRIIEYSWSDFQSYLGSSYRANRKQFLEDLRRLNGIRRKVMHPVRGTAPNQDDFEFVRSFKLQLQIEVIRESIKQLTSTLKERSQGGRAPVKKSRNSSKKYTEIE